MIPPGQVGELITRLDTSTLSGLVGKGVSIYSNDTRSPGIMVSVRARVVGSAVVLPGYKALLSNRRIETRSQPFLIRKEPGEVGDLRITGARASVPWIDVEVRELTENWPGEKGLPSGFPGDWLLLAALKPGAPFGQSQEEIRFNTGLRLEPEVRLSIATESRPPVNLNEPEISIVAGESSTILASLRGDLPPQAVKLTAPEGLNARAERGRRGRFFKIHLEWSGPVPSEPLELQMEIAGETQTIPVRVVDAN